MKLLFLGSLGIGEIILLLLPVSIIGIIALTKSGKKEREMENLGIEPVNLSYVRTHYKGFDIFFNILWHVPFLGFILALLTALGGVLCCITIIFLPHGMGMFQLAKFYLWPHGHAMVSNKFITQLTGKKQSVLWRSLSLINRIIYFPFGLILVIVMSIAVFISFFSIIGIPTGLVYIKALSTLFNPVNKVCVPAVVLKIMEERMMAACYRKGTTEQSMEKYRDNVNIPKTAREEIPVMKQEAPMSKYERSVNVERPEVNEMKPTDHSRYMPPTPSKVSDTLKQSTEPMKKQCPYCGEEVLAIAKKCKHCNEWFDNK